MIFDILTSPWLGLTVYREALVDGVTRDPSVSVPTAIGAKPALTAMAHPDEDPKGFFGRYQQDPNRYLRMIYTMATNAVAPVQSSAYVCRLSLTCGGGPCAANVLAPVVVN